MRPVGPDLGFPLSIYVSELQDHVGAIETPAKPTLLWSVLEASLPPAANWLGCICFVSDLGKVAVSNGTAWTDTTGGAL